MTAETANGPPAPAPAAKAAGTTKQGQASKPAPTSKGTVADKSAPKPTPVPKPAAAPATRGQVVDYPGVDIRPALPVRAKPRHWIVGLSFLLAVVLPTAASIAYLYAVAADQYASRVSFSIRGNENVSPISFLGALSQTVTVGGTDAEIVYDFVRSQQMVEAAMATLPLEEIFNLPDRDVVFRLGRDRPIEDIVTYWNRMTSVSFDAGSGIVHVQARAFDPESARAIAAFVLDESTRIVNAISTQAREDAVAVAREVLVQAEDRLREIRREIRAFRDVEQELDPSENARAALGLMAALRQQRAEAQVALDSYLALVGPRGPRVPELRQRIESLEQRIEEERQRLGAGLGGQGAAEVRLFADLMGDYEELMVELEFAQNAYVSALSSFEQAQVEARRQTRFLSPHIRPTLSVEAQYPQRALIALGIFVLLTVGWAVLVLIGYNIRDRR